MKTHTVELIDVKGDGQLWVVRGLPTDPEILKWSRMGVDSRFPRYAAGIGVDEEKDTILWGVGRDHSCDCVESEVAALFGALYDERQTNTGIGEGDVFLVSPASVNLYHSYDASAGTFDVPAMTFVADGPHIAAGDEATQDILDAAAKVLHASR